MNPNLSFVIKKYEGFGGNFVDSDYLAQAFDTMGPEMLSTTMARIFASQTDYFDSKDLLSATLGAGAKKTVSTDIFRWKMRGDVRRTAVSMENLESGNAAPGLNNTTFRIKLNYDFYHRPDVLFGESTEYPLAIQDGPIADGNGFIYTVKIQTDNPAIFFPPSLLETGKQFTKVWTTVSSEFNEEYGTQQVGSTFELESQLGYFAQGYTVTDKAMRQEGRLGIDFYYYDKGTEKKASRFMPAYEALMWNELYMSMEKQLMYGKKSTTPGTQGYWKKTGQTGPLRVVIHVAYSL